LSTGLSNAVALLLTISKMKVARMVDLLIPHINIVFIWRGR
jgi:hypothetical protein